MLTCHALYIQGTINEWNLSTADEIRTLKLIQKKYMLK